MCAVFDVKKEPLFRYSTAEQQEKQIELSPWKHGVFFLLACAVLVARRPDAIFHAQFWAEDGHVWIANAYNL